MVEKEGWMVGLSEAAPAGHEDVTCLVMVVGLIALQGHTVILLQYGDNTLRTSSGCGQAGIIRILFGSYEHENYCITFIFL